MVIRAIDTETTTWNKGHPFDTRNFIVCYSYASGGPDSSSIHSDAVKWGEGNLQELIDTSSLLVVFNGKFDFQWLVKEGFTYPAHKVWDVQLAHFILTNQTHAFPSLNEVCDFYGLGQKIDVIKTEYWDKGVNTHEIPWLNLKQYAALDSHLTLQCYYKQVAQMTPAQLTLCRLMSQDMSLLREMEANGIPFDEELCQVRAKEIDDKISTLNTELASIYPNVPINFGSNHHLSAFLYGGVVKEDGKEFVGYFKTGVRKGQPKHKNIIIEHTLPRLYQPLKGTEMAAEGVYATNEPTLRKLKGKKKIIDKILELSKLEKLNGTYYNGLRTLREEMGWPKGLLHGNFNQANARTGRLSSSKPNLQNFASELQDIFISKYTD